MLWLKNTALLILVKVCAFTFYSQVYDSVVKCMTVDPCPRKPCWGCPMNRTLVGKWKNQANSIICNGSIKYWVAVWMSTEVYLYSDGAVLLLALSLISCMSEGIFPYWTSSIEKTDSSKWCPSHHRCNDSLCCSKLSPNLSRRERVSALASTQSRNVVVQQRTREQ